MVIVTSGEAFALFKCDLDHGIYKSSKSVRQTSDVSPWCPCSRSVSKRPASVTGAAAWSSVLVHVPTVPLLITRWCRIVCPLCSVRQVTDVGVRKDSAPRIICVSISVASCNGTVGVHAGLVNIALGVYTTEVVCLIVELGDATQTVVFYCADQLLSALLNPGALITFIVAKLAFGAK